MDDVVDLDLLGTRCAVRCGDPDLARVVRHLWSPFLLPRSPAGAVLGAARTDAGWEVTGPEGRTVADSTHAALSVVATELNQLALARTPLFATHAAVVTIVSGAVVLVGASGVGKSTLTGALVRRGCGYLSDEALCLDRDTGAVVGYPRPLALSPWSRDAVGARPRFDMSEETLLTAADLGGSVAEAPEHVSHVVLLERPGEDGRPRLAPVPRQEAAAALLRRSFNHWHDPASSFRVAHQQVARAHAWRLWPTTPGGTADHLVARLAEGPTAPARATASKKARRSAAPPAGNATERGSSSS